MAAFGISAVHPTASRAHVFAHAATPTNATGNFQIWTGASSSNMVWRTHVDGDILPGPTAATALATTATDGFVYIRSCNGAATGVPSQGGTGRVPLVYDYANHALYAYHGAWRSVTLA